MESTIILVLDLFGTAVFAATGAVKGVRKRLDIFGVTVLGCGVGVGGGIVRDTMLGAVPAAALRHGMYLPVCIAVSVLIFMTARYWMHLRNLVQIGDAVGLGVFTAIGVTKGLQFDISIIGILLCGMFTAIGGGIIRDVLSGEIPVVLRSDFYATASLMGGALYCLLDCFELNMFTCFAATSVFVTAIRLAAMKYRIQLPSYRGRRRR